MSRASQLDERVLTELKRLSNTGRMKVSTGEIAKTLGVDSVKALGAIERVKGKFRIWLNNKDSNGEVLTES